MDVEDGRDAVTVLMMLPIVTSSHSESTSLPTLPLATPSSSTPVHMFSLFSLSVGPLELPSSLEVRILLRKNDPQGEDDPFLAANFPPALLANLSTAVSSDEL